MLEFKNINVSVGKVPILDSLSLDIERGKITTIVGPNGCGKTTLLQTLNGLSSVDKGEIVLNGENFLKLSGRERAKLLSFMPQFRESAPSISVKGLVEHGRFPYMGFSRKMDENDKRAVKSALEYTDLLDYSNHLVSELSGGMQQRTYLAMQLAQDSEYMVMDEPMNFLDFPSQREMYRMIKDLKEKGKTIVLVLHDINQALQISDKLIVMKDRKIIGGGSQEECLNSGLLQEVFDCQIKQVETDHERQFLLW